jgi:ribosome-associated toxin RatA of RatAB toxin-antitoxin module
MPLSMNELSATASAVTPAPIDRCFGLVADVERYPDWYPAGVKRVEVLERDADARPTLVAARLSLGDGPLRKDFNLQLAVETTAPDTSGVELRRVKRNAADGEQMVVAWALAPDGDAGTQLTVELRAALNLPPFLPVAAIAKSVADGFLAAALNALAE